MTVQELASSLAQDAAVRFKPYQGKAWNECTAEIKGEVEAMLISRFPILRAEYIHEIVERFVVIAVKDNVTRLEMHFEHIAQAILEIQ